MGSRTALSKFPDPCCPQWAETNSTDGVAAPVQESTAGGCQWLDTQAAEKSRGIQICGGGGEGVEVTWHWSASREVPQIPQCHVS